MALQKWCDGCVLMDVFRMRCGERGSRIFVAVLKVFYLRVGLAVDPAHFVERSKLPVSALGIFSLKIM